MTTVGDLWPFTHEDLTGLLEKYRADARYEEVVSGPLFAFRARE
jgi:hypothetical protein